MKTAIILWLLCSIILQLEEIGCSRPNPPASYNGCNCHNYCQVHPENIITSNGCENGEEFFSGHCYRFSTIKKTAWEAFMACKAIGAELVEIETSNENQFLMDYIAAHRPARDEQIWIGLTDVHDEGDWRWLGSGKPAIYTDWSDNQPDNFEGEECGTIDYGMRRWNDADCWERKYPFICESTATVSNPPAK